MRRAIRGLCLFMILLSIALPPVGRLLGPSPVEAQARSVVIVEVDGIINGVKDRFIGRAIEKAVEDEAALLVIELDTPGGLLDATRKIVEQVLEAPVPIAVFVSPRGARAGSAGTFITVAGHFAVMAPGTNIGAASPISGTGEDLEETLASKVENDAAALIRSIAQERGRNEEKLEETIREAASFSAREAVELNVVDFIANDIDDLLAQLHGKSVETTSGTHILDTRDLALDRVNKNLLENFLEFISDPNISFILFSIGGLGIVIELFNPGLIAPAVVGVIALILAFLAFGNLPVNWAGVAFILVAIVLAALEVVVAGFGVLGVGSIVCFILGALILFGGMTPTMPPTPVNRWLVAGVSAGVAASLFYVVWSAYHSRRAGGQETRPVLLGMSGTVTRRLAPRGVVRMGNETWTAISEDGNVIEAGQRVTVSKVDGLILTVSRKDDESPG